MNLPSISTGALTVIPPSPSGSRRPLLTPLPDLPNEYLLVIDNSSMEKFTTCPRSAYHYMVMGREAHARNAALTFGGAIHAGLESLLLGQSEELQNHAILHHFAKNPAPPDEYRTVDTALDVLRHYRQRATYPDYAWAILSDSSGPLVERAFELPIGVFDVDAPIRFMQDGAWTTVHASRIHVAWSGRMDLLAICGEPMIPRVCDHKTTSISGDQVIQDFQLSSQTLGYCWAANEIWPEHKIRGVCINFIHLKKPAKGLGLLDSGPRGGPPALSFFRSYFEYDEWRLSWWKEQALIAIEDFIHKLTTSHFNAVSKWCFGKYGKCQYHDICTTSGYDIQERLLLSDMFRDVTWNPVHE